MLYSLYRRKGSKARALEESVIYGGTEISPWKQERGSHAESRGDSHNIGHHDVGDENEHHSEGHDPLGRVVKK